MSGITSVPFFISISSASGVNGPFAASPMIFAFTLAALSLLITFSKLQGSICHIPTLMHHRFSQDLLHQENLR
jgi:hypothetical protein